MLHKVIWREKFKNKFILSSLLQKAQLDFFTIIFRCGVFYGTYKDVRLWK